MSVSQIELLEKTWEIEMRKGNTYFQSLIFSKAYPHYMDAVVVSDVLIENVTTSLQHSLRVPGMYYTACVNLANNYLHMKDFENASAYFLYCTYKLKMLADKPGANSSLKEAPINYWQKTVKQYMEFADKTGTPIPADIDKDETYVQLQKLKNLFTLPKEQMN